MITTLEIKTALQIQKPAHEVFEAIVGPDKMSIYFISKGSGRMEEEKMIKWLGQNTEGWANFLACLKAYLEYGINLRKGAFDFQKNTNE